MQRFKRIRLSGILALIFCHGSTLAWSQQVQPGYVGWEPGYSSASAAGDQSVSAAAGPTDQPPADWENWKAGVDARLTKMADSEAAAKKTAAGKPSVKVGGRIQADWAMFDQSPNNRTSFDDWGDRCEFRRARISLSGDAFYIVDYKLEMDFADNPSVYTGNNQSTSFKDVYITLKELPWLGQVRVGHFKEPFGLDQLTSSNYITFMERSLADENAIVPSRNMGVMAFDHSENERMTWAIGAFKSEMGTEPPLRKDEFEGGTALTMRYTFLPWYDEATEGRGLLHVGAAYSYRDVDDRTVQLRATPESHLAETVVESPAIDSDYWQILGAELAFVYGPFSAQTEYFGASIDSPGTGALNYNGCYAYVSYFLTGENRTYKRTEGVFDRVKPFEDFFRVGTGEGIFMGKGAWEIAYRYSYLDLNDALVAPGGWASDHTLGLNWYLNPYTRLMFNYVNSTISAGAADPPAGLASTVNIFEMRAQIDF